MNYLGDFAEDSTVRIVLTTNNASGGAVAPSSAFEADDFRIYKNGSATQKATTNGITIASPFDSVTGLHTLEIDTSNDTGDTGFWTTAADYWVVAVPDETVDSQTVVQPIAAFSIQNRYMRGTDGANTTTPPTVDAIADQVWDEILTGATHNIATSAGRRLRQLASTIVHSGTAQGAGTGNNQIQLDTGASSTNSAYDPGLVYIETGTGAGQTRLILQYNGSTRTATVDRDWRVNPDNTSEFVILGDAGRQHVNEGLAQAGTSTTITLNTNASSSDDAYNGQLIFIRSGTGQDQVALVEDYVGSTKVATIKTRSANGQWAVTPDSTSAYVMMPNLTWTIAEIQSGLATSTEVAAGFTEIKGAGWSSSTDTLEKIRDASGGSSSVTIAPLQATAPNRVAGTEIATYINDTSDIGPIVVTDGNGDAVDLSSYTLKICIERKENGTIDDNIIPTISGAGNNQVTFTPTAACVNSTTPRKWSLRSTSNGQVFAFGDFKVEWPARLS